MKNSWANVRRLSENPHLLFDRLTALSKVEGMCPCFARTPHPSGGSPVSDALHLEIFHQPPIELTF